jgi:hypothetical protein
MPWFAAEPVDERFLDSAPVRLEGVFDISRPAAEVWGDLTGDSPLQWCRILDEIKWTSTRPFGVGTTRSVRSLKGTNRLKEYYFRWEEGRRKSFYVVEASAPFFRRFAEDYLVEPTADAACRFTWVIAYDLKPLGRAAAPVNRRLLGTLFTDTRKHYGAS